MNNLRTGTALVAGAALVAGSACLTACRSPASAPVAAVEAFRAARSAGDLQIARGYLCADPRRWWGAQEGPGAEWVLAEGGPWQGWDEHFNGRTERRGDWHEEPDRVWAEFFETNDYFRLIERGGGYWRGTYFFDADGKIAGFMVSASPGREAPSGRGDEFRAWAFEHHPLAAEYLMPAGSIDPTGDRPPRMRALLEAWRSAVGLAPLAAAAPDG